MFMTLCWMGLYGIFVSGVLFLTRYCCLLVCNSGYDIDVILYWIYAPVLFSCVG